MTESNERFLLTWEIENFSFWNKKCGEFLQSPSFAVENIFGSIWYIIFCITEGENSEEFVSIKLCTEQCASLVTVNFKIEFCDSEDRVIFRTERNSIQFFAESKYPIPNVLRKLDLEEKIKNLSTDKFIIRCRMDSGKSSEIDHISNRTVRTKICLDQLLFMWNIKYSETSTWKSKKLFPINEEVQLIIIVKAPRDDILFDIDQVDNKTKYRRRIKCEITLIDKKGLDKFSFCVCFTYGGEPAIWNSPNFFKRSSIEKHLKHQFLRLKVKFSVSNDLTFIDCVEEADHQGLSSDCLTNNLRALLSDEEFTDVSFRIENVAISAHRCILALRSPVFLAMFKQNMVENETGVIDITDMDVQTLRLFLEFVYTGEIKLLDWKQALNVLLVAEKYQVPSLNQKCSQFLKTNLTTDNICDVLSVADMVGEQGLKIAAINYIKGNSEQIFGSPTWLKWIKQNVELCSEIFYSLSQEFKTIQKKI